MTKIRGLVGISFAGFLFIFIQCVPSKVLLSPVPSELISVEGYASLRIYGGDNTVRTKFSFLFLLPDQGDIVASNFLGQTIYRITITSNDAFLIIPSKKVYWKGKEEEIIDTFLGFKLNMREMISLLTGEWQELGLIQEDRKDQRWEFEKDPAGRIISGWRDSLRFEIEEFVNDSRLARVITFDSMFTTGRVRLIKAAFNKPVRPESFSSDFLLHYQQKSWEEIQALIDNES